VGIFRISHLLSKILEANNLRNIYIYIYWKIFPSLVSVYLFKHNFTVSDQTKSH
jgi:uncharacterized membrane protein